MEEICLAYDLPKEIIKIIIMFFSNTKIKVRSLDGDADFLSLLQEICNGID